MSWPQLEKGLSEFVGPAQPSSFSTFILSLLFLLVTCTSSWEILNVHSAPHVASEHDILYSKLSKVIYNVRENGAHQ